MTDPTTYWDERYAARTPSAELTPNPALIAAVAGRPPGRALELGCGHGDASIWLAQHGWTALAVDVSAVALERVEARAAERGVGARVTVERHDLARSLPSAAPFDLVAALFFQSELDLPRVDVLRGATALVAPGGALLDVTHAAAPPWAAEHHHDRHFPTAGEVWDELGLDPAAWRVERLEQVDRATTGPDGRPATLLDAVLLARRAGGR